MLQLLYFAAIITLLYSLPFYKLIVPTVDTVRYSYLTTSLVSAHHPILLVGPVGTGKTSVAQGVLSKLDPKTYSVLTVNMSAQVLIFVTILLVLLYIYIYIIYIYNILYIYYTCTIILYISYAS